ncbi:MAG TPA: hypothetical protein PLL19_05365 [Thiobacillaceae bacterium]|nr:hypothetical protein [Thiobacillaceae bacterium]HNA82376.1 hypothetical protein [Thiobacillaceae bacterium]HNF88739.1 hypothetical protein [Thiobacillaceae bacterium]HNH88748.1 hypothetical protein [Thiobacillaceae bacterium]HNI06748.1 hypothetical protein [Thiobacillaceae bacterium]
MNNTVTTAEIKRRGMAAIEEGLRLGPLHILKHNKPAAVVLSEEEYQRLAQSAVSLPEGLSALQWLLRHRGTGSLDKAEIDASLQAERDSWGGT